MAFRGDTEVGRALVAALAAACVFVAVAVVAPVASADEPDVIEGYVVKLYDWIEDPQTVAEEHMELYGGHLHNVSEGSKSYFASSLTVEDAEAIAADPRVELVYPESLLTCVVADESCESEVPCMGTLGCISPGALYMPTQPPIADPIVAPPPPPSKRAAKPKRRPRKCKRRGGAKKRAKKSCGRRR